VGREIGVAVSGNPNYLYPEGLGSVGSPLYCAARLILQARAKNDRLQRALANEVQQTQDAREQLYSIVQPWNEMVAERDAALARVEVLRLKNLTYIKTYRHTDADVAVIEDRIATLEAENAEWKRRFSEVTICDCDTTRNAENERLRGALDEYPEKLRQRYGLEDGEDFPDGESTPTELFVIEELRAALKGEGDENK
jgi:hypothetical protein